MLELSLCVKRAQDVCVHCVRSYLKSAFFAVLTVSWVVIYGFSLVSGLQESFAGKGQVKKLSMFSAETSSSPYMGPNPADTFPVQFLEFHFAFTLFIMSPF